jgi:hypothetical protein
MQRFRGRVYLADRAISAGELTADGRHVLDIDEDSWHLLTLDADRSVCGCVRILDRTGARSLDQLWIRNSALTDSASWGGLFRSAIETEMKTARKDGLRFGEVGGLAMSPESRGTMTSLRTILGTFGFLQLLGGARCVVTATARHGCAQILRRIGLSPLVSGGKELPQYYDPQFGCEMQVLRFDSRYPAPKYLNWVGELATYLKNVPVVAGGSRTRAYPPAHQAQLPFLPGPGAAAWAAVASR